MEIKFLDGDFYVPKILGGGVITSNNPPPPIYTYAVRYWSVPFCTVLECTVQCTEPHSQSKSIARLRISYYIPLRDYSKI